MMSKMKWMDMNGLMAIPFEELTQVLTMRHRTVQKRKTIDSQNYPVYYYLYQAILWLILIHTNIDPVATAMQKSSRLTAFDVQQVRQRWQHSWGTLGVMVGRKEKKKR